MFLLCNYVMLFTFVTQKKIFCICVTSRLRRYVSSDSEVIESIFVEIMVPQGKNIIVGCVYRPPNQNTALFLEKFNDILTIITKDNKHCYVMGDFNLDLLQYNHHVPTQEFIDSLFSHAFFLLFQIQLASPLTLQH